MGILGSENVTLSKVYDEHICFKELDEEKVFYGCVSDRFFPLPLGTKALQIMKTMFSSPFMNLSILLRSCC